MTVQTLPAPVEAPTISDQSPGYGLKPQGQWQYEDWLHFPDDGWRYEILDGVLHMMPPPTIVHQRSSGRLFAQMFLYAQQNKLGEVLEAPCGVKLPQQTVPVEPDIFFIKQERLEIIGQDYVYGSPDLVVEIMSPSNPNYDRQRKFRLYEQNGLPEYWLVNYWDKRVEVFVLRGEEYQLQGRYDMGQTVISEQLTGFTIEVATIFDF